MLNSVQYDAYRTFVDELQCPESDCPFFTIDEHCVGITCENNHITHIELAQNIAYQGTISSSIGLLTALTYLKIHQFSNGRSPLKGTLPTQLGLLTNMNILSITLTSIDGTIPSQLGRLAALESAFFGANRLEGQIPSQIGQLTSLVVLHFYLNRVSRLYLLFCLLCLFTVFLQM